MNFGFTPRKTCLCNWLLRLHLLHLSWWHLLHISWWHLLHLLSLPWLHLHIGHLWLDHTWLHHLRLLSRLSIQFLNDKALFLARGFSKQLTHIDAWTHMLFEIDNLESDA